MVSGLWKVIFGRLRLSGGPFKGNQSPAATRRNRFYANTRVQSNLYGPKPLHLESNQ